MLAAVRVAGANLMSEMSKSRKVAGWALVGLLGAMLMASAGGKIIGADTMRGMFGKWGLEDWMLIVGLGELASAILFVVPRTHSLGVLLLSAYFGGAIATHMQHGEPFVIPAALLVLVWLAGYLRNVGLLASLFDENPCE